MRKETSSPSMASPPSPMSIPLLPPDTLAIILSFLSTSKSTLHSCALVNRMWCRLSIPLLWSNPLSLIHQSSTLDWCSVGRDSAMIIEVYVACLSDEEKRCLVDEEAIDSDEAGRKGNSENTKSDGFFGTTRFRETPLFNYIMYLKSLDCEQFHSAVDRWVNMRRNIWKESNWIDGTPPSSLMTSTLDSTAYLTNIIFRRSKGIKDLSFRCLKETTISAMNISRFTSAQEALRKLENFDIVYYPNNKYVNNSYSDNDPSSNITNEPKCPLTSIFTSLTKSSPFLRTLALSLSPSSSPPVSAIFELIRSQLRLQSLKLNEFFPDCRYEELCSALSTQVRSLRHLELSEFSRFPLELERMLVNCVNLERLDIRGGELKIHEDQDHYEEGEEEDGDHYESEEVDARTNRHRWNDYAYLYNKRRRRYNYYCVSHLQEPSDRIMVNELSISRCSSQDSIIHLLTLVSPFHLQKLVIDNCTTEIIDVITECAPNLTHLDIRVASDVELQSSRDPLMNSSGVRMYANSNYNYSTVNINWYDVEWKDELYNYYENNLDTFEEFIQSTKDCIHHLRCLEHFVLRLNTNITDSDFEIIDSVRDILDSLPRSVNHVGLEMNFQSIQELCIVLSGRRGDELNKLDLCWQGRASFDEVVEVLNKFWKDVGWASGEGEEVKRARLFYGYGGGLRTNGGGFLNGRSTCEINAESLGEMLNENIVIDIIENPFIPLHFA